MSHESGRKIRRGVGGGLENSPQNRDRSGNSSKQHRARRGGEMEKKRRE